MSNEVTHNFKTGQTLYFARFAADGNVLTTDGSVQEAWGTAGRDADDYDVAMTEVSTSRHYTGPFDTSGNIAAATYNITVYLQSGVNPADTDPAIAQGEIYWDGTAEITLFTIDADINTIIGVGSTVKNVYGRDELTTEAVGVIISS